MKPEPIEVPRRWGPCWPGPGIWKPGGSMRRKISGMSASSSLACALRRDPTVASTFTTPGPTCSTSWVKSGRPVTSCGAADCATAGAEEATGAGASACCAQAASGVVSINTASRPLRE